AALAEVLRWNLPLIQDRTDHGRGLHLAPRPAGQAMPQVLPGLASLLVRSRQILLFSRTQYPRLPGITPDRRERFPLGPRHGSERHRDCLWLTPLRRERQQPDTRRAGRA